MKIEAMTVSINYSDCLEECIPNRRFLDRWLIITHESDEKTIELCKKNNLEYICSKKIYENGAPFAKGKAIREGMKLLDRDDWLLQLDSDIVLPDDFKEVLDKEGLQKGILYGSPRMAKDDPKKSLYGMMGFFQLWHSSIMNTYSDLSQNAAYDDFMVMKYFTCHFKIKELQMTCVDLLDERNWDGRKV